MAAKKRTHTTTGKTKKRGKYEARGNNRKPAYNSVSREIGAMVSLGLCMVVVIAMFGSDALLLRWIRSLIRGLVGYGFYMLPFCLLLTAATLFFHRGRPVKMRVISTMSLPVTVGAMVHIAASSAEISWKLSTLKDLYLSGAAGASGGLISGLVAEILHTALGSFLSMLLLIVGTLVLLIMAFNMTVASLIRAIKNRPRPEPEEEEPEEEPIDTATALVNHVAQRHMEKTARKARFAYDVPIDEEEKVPERKSLLRAPTVKSPDQLIQERRAAMVKAAAQQAAQPELQEEPLQTVIPDTAPVQSVPVTTPIQTEEPEQRESEEIKRMELVPPVPQEPEPPVLTEPIVPEVQKTMWPKETQQAAVEIAQDIAEQPGTSAEYHYPPISLLDAPTATAVNGYTEMRENQQRLANTLQSFGIDAEIQNVTRGPSVTRYELKLDQGVKLSKITNLADDIALSLGASGVRISAIPDQISVVGIEVPNKVVSTVYAREVIDSPEFRNHKSRVAFAVGKDIGGNAIVGNIAKLPHMLIAGTTGSGKSVCMNTLIISLLYKSKPEEVKLIMVDPKMVELGIYNGIPHLLIPVVTDPKKAAGALQWAVTEMMRRYRLMADAGVRDLESYNKQAATTGVEPMAQLVVVIDELADLMLVAAKEVEESICRVAQMGRASGIHLVIATQRPSADVITGLMKANIPSRIAFAVASSLESRIILDSPGAEKLVGKGDMLFAPLGQGKPMRVQGCFISDDEVQRVVEFIKKNTASDYNDSIMQQIERHAAETGKPAGKTMEEEAASHGGYDDELLPAAVEVILETGQASVSMLQRRLKLGYARAARIVDEMEDRGIVGPFEGSKPRQLLITRDQWQQMQGETEEPDNPPGEEEIP